MIHLCTLGGCWRPSGGLILEKLPWIPAQHAGCHSWDKLEDEQHSIFAELLSSSIDARSFIIRCLIHCLCGIVVLSRCACPGSGMLNRMGWCKELAGDKAVRFLEQTSISPGITSPWPPLQDGTKRNSFSIVCYPAFYLVHQMKKFGEFRLLKF